MVARNKTGKTYASLRPVCVHCGEPDWHRTSCICYIVRARGARVVLKKEKGMVTRRPSAAEIAAAQRGGAKR